ncbi:MAG: serine/threonine protein kinase, partial [Deltaproteobacteria bacterium]|nr:serine/threonine protein kinase [Deltaproteobacteria bacterium]
MTTQDASPDATRTMPRRRDDATPRPRPPSPPAGQPAAPSSMLAAGAVVERFVLLVPIGAGGRGEVWSAYDPELDRKIALKFVHPHGDAPPQTLARLLREAQALARLQHPNVVTVFDVGTHRGQVFLAMELVEGMSAAQWLAARTRSWREVCTMMMAAGRGLAASHAAGLVHRDFKPSNVMVAAGGRVLVVDFGLAVATGASSGPAGFVPHSRLGEAVTDDDVVMGTLPYMAPERLHGGEVSPASDQWSYCVALFEALAGRRPFEGGTLAEVSSAVRGAAPVEHLPSTVPRWLAAIVARGLARDPGARYGSMEALLTALRRGTERRRQRALVVGLVALMSAGVGVGVGWAVSPEPTAAQIEQLQQLTAEAREAAERGRFLHPASTDPEQETALQLVMRLEQTEGPAATRSTETARQLRSEFAERLVELAEHYQARPGGEAFAADFYAAALVFEPDHEMARARCTLSPGQVDSLRAEASAGDFSPRALVTYDAHGVLAESDSARRKVRATALMDQAGGIADSTRARLRGLVEDTPPEPEAVAVRDAGHPDSPSADHDDDDGGSPPTASDRPALEADPAEPAPDPTTTADDGAQASGRARAAAQAGT